MELNQEFIEQHSLNEDQVKALSSYAENYISDIKNEWDGKANENAEKILEGASKYASEKFGVKEERKQGEKWGDYLQRVSEVAVSSTKENLEGLKKDYENKLKEFKGGDALKSELEEVKSKYDEALQKSAKYDEWEKENYKGKYEETTNKYQSLKQRLAFTDVKPKFPETVNEYEAKAKWSDFEKEVLEAYNIEIDENNEAIAVSKENQYKVVKLKELVKQNQEVNELLKERKPSGLGSEPAKVEIDGVPFKVKDNASSSERAQAIRDYLASKGVGQTDAKYSKLFAEYNAKILEKTPTNS